MIEQQIRDLFAATADGEPGSSQVDLQAARHRGRSRLRRRRAGLAGASALVTAVAAAVAMMVPAQQASRPVPAGPAAPSQFSPLTTNAAFGWLPPGTAIVQGRVDPDAALVWAGSEQVGLSVQLQVYARGRCQFTDRASGLKCRDLTVGSTARLSKRAPDVNGRAAYWAGPGLIWSYARGGWASIIAYRGDGHSQASQAETLRIARNVRVGAAAPHVLFPAQFTGLTRDWQVADTYFVADSGRLRAEWYTLRTASSRLLWSDFADTLWTNAALVVVQPNGTCVIDSSRHHIEVINGSRVIVEPYAQRGRPGRSLCAEHANGLWLKIMELGPRPAIGVVRLFRHHVHVLGRNPANWTQNPVG